MVRLVWSAIFPPNRNFRFYQIWYRHRIVKEEHQHQTNWISIGLVWPAFDCFQFLRNQTDQRKKEKKNKKFVPLLSHIFLTPKHQAPSSKKKIKKNKKKKLKIMYIFREHTKIRIYIYIYIFSFAFPRFLTTQTPSTKQSSKHKKIK